MLEGKIGHHLDLRGQLIPYPTLEPLMALNEMAAGEVLEVITDNYPIRSTIAYYMRKLGYACLMVNGNRSIFRLLIQKN